MERDSQNFSFILNPASKMHCGLKTCFGVDIAPLVAKICRYFSLQLHKSGEMTKSGRTIMLSIKLWPKRPRIQDSDYDTRCWCCESFWINPKRYYFPHCSLGSWYMPKIITGMWLAEYDLKPFQIWVDCSSSHSRGVVSLPSTEMFA